MSDDVSAPLRVAAYLRVSTQEQGESGAGLEAQRAAIDRAAELKGWSIVDYFVDAGASGKTVAKRDGLQSALAALETGGADVLVVSKLDRLSRSVVDFGLLLQRSQRRGWGLVVLDLDVDTTTFNGEFIAHLMASVAQWERRVIGQRTKDALAARRKAGVRLGRPPVLPASVVDEILDWRAIGLSYAAIADELNRQEIKTARGGPLWYPSTVRAVAVSLHAQQRAS